MSQSGYGRIKLFNDFTGPEIQVSANMEHASATGALWNIGNGFTIKGQNLDQTDAGAVASEDALNGQIVLTSSATAGGDACFCTTETCFKPSVNGTMSLEARVEMSALTTRRVFVGFSGTVADAQSTICSGSTATITLTESNLCGFLYDSSLTTDIEWHTVYNGGSTTGETTSTNINSGVTPVAAQMDVLRVEIDNNGTARWYINGVLEKTLAGAVSTTAVFGACVGVVSTTTTASSVTVDYMAVEANRDWTV